MHDAIEKYTLFLIKPDGTEYGELNHYALNIFFSAINEISSISFKLPETITNNDGTIKTNPYYNTLKPTFRVRLNIDNGVKGTIIREFKISTPNEKSDGNKTDITYNGYSREVELNQKSIISFAGVPIDVDGSTGIVIENDGTITANPIVSPNIISYTLDGLTIADMAYTLLSQMSSLWTLAYVDPDLQDIFRSDFDITDTVGLNVLRELQYTYDAILVPDTINQTISYYKIDNLGNDLGWSIEYGKYLKTIEKDEKVEDVVTRMRAVGSGGIGIETKTYTGQNYLEDYTYFLGSFARTGLVVDAHSEWMSDSLAGAILDYNDAIAAQETALDALFVTRDALIVDQINKQNEITYLNSGQDITEELISVVHAGAVSKVTLSNDSTILSTVSGIGTVEALLLGVYETVSYQTTPDGEDEFDVTGENYRYPVETYSGSNYPSFGSVELYFLTSEYPPGTQFRVFYRTFGLNLILDSKSVYESWRANPAITAGQLLVANEIIDYLIDKETERKAEIAVAEGELAVIIAALAVADGSIDTIQDGLSVDNNFTSAQQIEWENFIVEGVYQNIEISDLDLLLSATQEALDTAKLPELNITTDIISILQTEDSKVDWDKVNLFDFVNIRFERLDIDIQARVLEIRMNVDSYKLNILVSTTTNYIKDDKHFYQRAIEKSLKSSAKMDAKIEEWNKSENNSEILDEFNEDGIQTGDYPINSSNDDSVKIDKNGMTIEEKFSVDSAQNPVKNTPSAANDQRYTDKIIRLMNGGLYLSKDGGKTFSTAITADQVFAQVIKGELLVGDELLIIGNDGSSDIVKIGNIDTTGDLSDDDFGVIINGVVSGNNIKVIMARDSGFVIKVDTGSGFVDKFKVDSSGKIEATGIVIKDEATGEVIFSDTRNIGSISASKSLGLTTGVDSTDGVNLNPNNIIYFDFTFGGTYINLINMTFIVSAYTTSGVTPTDNTLYLGLAPFKGSASGFEIAFDFTVDATQQTFVEKIVLSPAQVQVLSLYLTTSNNMLRMYVRRPNTGASNNIRLREVGYGGTTLVSR